MQVQSEQTFEMDTTSITSKNSRKIMEELERNLNQDFEEEGQDPNLDVLSNVDEFLQQIMGRTKEKESINKRTRRKKNSSRIQT